MIKFNYNGNIDSEVLFEDREVKVDKKKHILLGSYGSNMKLRLQERVPNAELYKIIFIKNFHLTCNKLSITGTTKFNFETNNSNPEGLLLFVFKIDKNLIYRLDGFEGSSETSNSYSRMTVEIDREDIITYIADSVVNADAGRFIKPFKWYSYHLLKGIIDAVNSGDLINTPTVQKYLDKVHKIHNESVGDKDKARIAKELSIYPLFFQQFIGFYNE